MDPVGVALAMAGIIAFILAFEYGGQKKPWNSSTVIGLIVGDLFIWVAFFTWEYLNPDRAMLPRHLLKQHHVWFPSMYQFFFVGPYYILLYYLPVYFQVIDNRTAISSGVLNLPFVIASTIGSIIAGTTISKTGQPVPFLIGAAVFATVSTGLIYTFDIGTPMGKWIGYQILYGCGTGLGFNMCITIAQGHSKLEDISVVSAIVFCKPILRSPSSTSGLTLLETVFQTLGGSFALTSAQSAFVNQLIIKLGKLAPNINPQTVVGTGATQIRHVFSVNEVPVIVVSYMAGIKAAFILSLCMIGVCCLLAPLVPRKRLHSGAPPAAAA